jgi:hypothetical protein
MEMTAEPAMLVLQGQDDWESCLKIRRSTSHETDRCLEVHRSFNFGWNIAALESFIEPTISRVKPNEVNQREYVYSDLNPEEKEYLRRLMDNFSYKRIVLTPSKLIQSATQSNLMEFLLNPAPAFFLIYQCASGSQKSYLRHKCVVPVFSFLVPLFSSHFMPLLHNGILDLPLG